MCLRNYVKEVNLWYTSIFTNVMLRYAQNSDLQRLVCVILLMDINIARRNLNTYKKKEKLEFTPESLV